MQGFLGLDADSWGNVIAAGTGVFAIVGGAFTVSRTARLGRKARAEEHAAARASELRAQSRESIVRVIECTNQYDELIRGRQRQGPFPRLALPHANTRDEQTRLVRRIKEAAILVHDDQTRRALLTGTEVFELDGWYIEEDEWDADRVDERTRQTIALVGDLAAAYLRDDEAARSRFTREVAARYAEGKRMRDSVQAEGE